MKLDYSEDAKRFYRSKAWAECRNGYMTSQNFICERCGNTATICHHKTYLDAVKYDQPEYSLNWDNLEALCHRCHNQEHFKTDGVLDGLMFDAKGNVIKRKINAVKKLKVILGYPASGKTTYVENNAKYNDITLDMDKLRSVLIRQDRNKDNLSINLANDMMHMALSNIISRKYRTDGDIYFIRTYMEVSIIETLLNMGASVYVKERSKADCIETLKHQNREIPMKYFDKIERMIDEINYRNLKVNFIPPAKY